MECSGPPSLASRSMSVDAARSQPHAGGDAGRPAEGEGAELKHGEAVDLADRRALGVDQHDAAIDGLLRPVAQAVGALDVLVDGAHHVLPGGHLALGLARPVVGLAHQIGDASDLDGQLLAVVGQARAFVDDARDAGCIDGLQAVLLDDRCDQARVGVVVLGRAGDGVVEVGLHLEEAREVRIVRGEQVVELPIAEQHDLDVERDGLRDRGSAWRSGRRPRPAARCESRAPLMARFKRLPGERRQQQPARIQQQIAAVGRCSAPGLIRRKSVTSVPIWAMCSTRPTRLP